MKKIYALALGLATVFAAGAQNDAKSLYESGKKAEDAFNKEIPSALATGQMSPENAFAIVEAYNFYVKALPLDSVPNEKGKVKPVVSKKIVTSFGYTHSLRDLKAVQHMLLVTDLMYTVLVSFVKSHFE